MSGLDGHSILSRRGMPLADQTVLEGRKTGGGEGFAQERLRCPVWVDQGRAYILLE